MSKQDINTLWDDVRGWLTDATRTAIREAEDLSRRGRLKIDILNLSRKIEKRMARLGGMVYGSVSVDPDTPVSLDSDARRVIRDISRLETELKDKQRQYAAEKKKARKSRS